MKSAPNALVLAVLFVFATPLAAQTKKLTMSGTVIDKHSHEPVKSAEVSVVGNKANQDSTDSEGSFILSFSEGVHEGDAVRIRVEKSGYDIYDEWTAVSSEIPLHIYLESARSRLKTKPALPTNKLTSQPAASKPTPSESHGTTDAIQTKAQYHGTTDEATPRTEGAAAKGPRLGTGPDAYKDIDDVQVGQWTMEEANKIEDMANSTMAVGSASPDAERWFFKNKFNDCCAQDVYELRTEVLRRLGPPAKDPDEISAWTMLFPQLKYPGAPDRIDPATVRYYAPYLRRLGLRLKRRAAPRLGPLTLKFSEQELPPEKPGYSHIVVTIETTKELTSGYIAVQFIGQPYSVGCDFQNSKLALTAEVPADNPSITELLKVSTNYVLQIGKTPFSPSNPVHVEARGSSQIHVSRVTFLDE